MNLRTALKALDILGELSDAAAEGLCHFGELSCLRGRWERLCDSPELICDIGHNPPALELNFGRLERMRRSGAHRRPLLVVYGVMRDKDLGSILHLFPSDAEYIFCAPSTPRALPAEELLRTVKAARPELDCSVAGGGGSVREAIIEALRRASSSASAGAPASPGQALPLRGPLPLEPRAASLANPDVPSPASAGVPSSPGQALPLRGPLPLEPRAASLANPDVPSSASAGAPAAEGTSDAVAAPAIVYVGGSTFVVSEALSIDKDLLSCTLKP